MVTDRKKCNNISDVGKKNLFEVKTIIKALIQRFAATVNVEEGTKGSREDNISSFSSKDCCSTSNMTFAVTAKVEEEDNVSSSNNAIGTTNKPDISIAFKF